MIRFIVRKLGRYTYMESLGQNLLDLAHASFSAILAASPSGVCRREEVVCPAPRCMELSGPVGAADSDAARMLVTIDRGGISDIIGSDPRGPAGPPTDRQA